MILAAISRGRHGSRLALVAILVVNAAACGDPSAPTSALPAPVPFSGAIDRPQVRPGDFWEYQVAGGEAPSRWTLSVDEVRADGRFQARIAEGAAPIGAVGEGANLRRVEFDGPWNAVQPDPAWMLRYLQFPLTNAAQWTSTATGPGSMTRTLTQQVVGMQALAIAGASVACVRIEGTEATTVSGPPAVTVSSQSTLWYCPDLRAVGRVETGVAGGPRVTQTLIAVQLVPATPP